MSIFNLDSPIMRALGRLADLLWLNILTLLLCIPVITAGAAFTAMNYMALKIVRDEDCYITRGYFKSFKENFKQATVIWLIMLAITLVLAGDFKIMAEADVDLPRALRIAIVAVTVILSMIAMYVFPVLSRYENTIRNTFKNAAIMAIVSFPKTILMLVIWCIPVILLYLSERLFPIVFMFGISGPVMLCALLYNGTFKRFEPNVAEDEAEKADPDQWHVYKEGEEHLDKADKESMQKVIQENLETVLAESGDSDKIQE